GLRDWKKFLITGAAFFGALVIFWRMGITKALPLMSSSLCAAILVSMVMLLAEKSTRAWRPAVMACLVHISVALMALGISFSGPYKQEVEVELARGQATQVGPYSVTLSNMYEGRGANFDYIEAELQVSKDGKVVSVLSPQRRLYDKWQRSAFSEATTYPSLGSEFYATLLGVSGDSAVLRMSSNPLVNWLWIGGALMSLAPFIGLTRKRRPKADGKAPEAA
ncbi:MAG: heme lyase CcmF/NrfE family subunit, partial [Mailhella sp.]|nr:heme lyase CcmF/NrfE family subunit [Mailhella sp.]